MGTKDGAVRVTEDAMLTVCAVSTVAVPEKSIQA